MASAGDAPPRTLGRLEPRAGGRGRFSAPRVELPKTIGDLLQPLPAVEPLRDFEFTLLRSLHRGREFARDGLRRTPRERDFLGPSLWAKRTSRSASPSLRRGAGGGSPPARSLTRSRRSIGGPQPGSPGLCEDRGGGPTNLCRRPSSVWQLAASRDLRRRVTVGVWEFETVYARRIVPRPNNRSNLALKNGGAARI